MYLGKTKMFDCDWKHSAYDKVTKPPMPSHSPSRVKTVVLKYLGGSGICYDMFLDQYILSSNESPLPATDCHP